MDNKVADIAADTNSAEPQASRGQVRTLITNYFTEVIQRQGADADWPAEFWNPNDIIGQIPDENYKPIACALMLGVLTAAVQFGEGTDALFEPNEVRSIVGSNILNFYYLGERPGPADPDDPEYDENYDDELGEIWELNDYGYEIYGDAARRRVIAKMHHVDAPSFFPPAKKKGGRKSHRKRNRKRRTRRR